MNNHPAETEAVSAALTLPQRAAVALGAVDYEAKIKEQVAASTDITAVIDPAGREQAHRIGMNLLKLRTGIKAVGEAARKDATDFSKAIIAKEKDLIALITPEEERVFKLRDAYDAKVEADKQAAIAKERERVAAIQDDIAAIHDMPLTLVGKSAAEIEATAAEIAAIVVSKERFAEFEKDASKVLGEVTVKLVSLHAAAVASEEETARIAAERAELAALREAAAEAKRLAQVETERVAAERKAEDDRRAALAAEQEAEAPSAPTDISARLRFHVSQNTVPYPKDILAAAAEIERYYGGMLAWKQAAETKDRKLSAEITARIDERVATRLAARPSAPAVPMPHEPTPEILAAIMGTPWEACGNGMRASARSRYTALCRVLGGTPTALASTMQPGERDAVLEEAAEISDNCGANYDCPCGNQIRAHKSTATPSPAATGEVAK